MNLEQYLWVEKYRPTKLEDLILPEEYKKTFEVFIKNLEIPHLLFIGSPGSGKTTLAKILTSKEGVLKNPKYNLLEANGSAKATRGIDFVENVIEPFLVTPTSGTDKVKIVFIDEGDFLTEASFNSLKGIIEKYSEYGRFLITANDIYKIPSAIRSRFQDFSFKQISIDYIKEYSKRILSSEKIDYIEDDILHVISQFYPDVRKIVNTIQKLTINGKLVVNKNQILNNEKLLILTVCEIVLSCKQKENHKLNPLIDKIIKILDEQDLDFRSIYNQLFKRNELIVPTKIIVNKYGNSHSDCLIPSMHFLAMIYEIIKSINDYIKLT